MLKHVHNVSPYSSCRGAVLSERLKQHSTAASSNSAAASPSVDTVSLNSSCSYGSSQDALSSRSSSASMDSLPDPTKCNSPSIPIKLFATNLRPDIEYMTLGISYQTTSKDLIQMALNKYRMKHRDPNLFFLTMEIGIRKTGLPYRTVMVLDDEAHPADLQSCQPIGHSKFSLQIRRGGLVKVYDNCLMPASQYKSLLISEHTTVEELIQLLLNCYNLKERCTKFSLYEVCSNSTYERQLHPADYPLLIQQEWPRPDGYAFKIKRNQETNHQRKKLLWTKSLDMAGNINFRLSLRDEVNPKIIHSPTLKPSYNDYENYFYI